MMTSDLSIKRGQTRLSGFWFISFTLIAALTMLVSGCSKQEAPTAPAAKATGSQIQISATAGGTSIATPTAEFVIAPSGYITASLVSGGRKLSLDDAGTDSGTHVTAAGQQLPDATFDVDRLTGFSGGDVAPWFPGSRFTIFDN